MKTSICRHPRGLALGIGIALVGSVGLGACGSSTKTAAAPTTTTTGSRPATATGPSARGGAFPGASGSVAAISGSSMEVQNAQTGQVTVSWKASTAFTKTATLTASSVAAGDCVTVTGTTTKGLLVARSVVVSKPTDGSCTRRAFAAGGFGRGSFGGAPTAGGRSGPPAGGSGTAPTGGSGPGGRRFGSAAGFSFASGKVTSVTSTGLVLSGFSSADLAKGAKGASTADTTVKVGLASSTTYSETEAAASSALAVGDCVTATGQTSSTGAVSATTVRITSTGGKSCTTGFGGFGGFGGGPAGG